MSDGPLEIGRRSHRAGDLNRAEELYRQAIETDPQQAESWFLLGMVCEAQGRVGEALTHYERAVDLRPGYPAALHQLGLMLAALGRHAEAVVRFRDALRRETDSARVYNSLGLSLSALQHFEEAIQCYRNAAHLRPDGAEVYSNWGMALARLDRIEEAVSCCEKAIQLKPDLPGAHLNLGWVAEQSGQRARALTCFDRAVQLNPTYADAHMKRAMLWLQEGNFDAGWPEYEWRWQTADAGNRGLTQPLWVGSPLKGRTILLYAEQGLGDTIQFVRYAPQVRRRVGWVVVECQKELLKLLSRCLGIDRLVARGSALPAFDVQAPLLSLPGILRTDLNTVPGHVPYVFADRDHVSRWREELNRLQGTKIGIAWQGNQTHFHDRRRSIPLKAFAQLARVPGVRLVSLQKGPGIEQLRDLRDGFGLLDLGGRLDDFMDTAAIMKNLDLVITADTAVAHLAGSLGVPVWVALATVSDWRWLLGREDSPWYPTMRLFRQERSGDWDQVFGRMAQAISTGAPDSIGSPRSARAARIWHSCRRYLSKFLALRPAKTPSANPSSE